MQPKFVTYLYLLFAAIHSTTQNSRRKRIRRFFFHNRYQPQRFHNSGYNFYKPLELADDENVKREDADKVVFQYAQSYNNNKSNTRALISKKKQFILKCPKSFEEHWQKKVNYTVDWSLNGIHYLTILRRNSFPRLEFINHYAKLIAKRKGEHHYHHRRHLNRLIIQQWPNIDGRSVSAIVYMNPNAGEDETVNESGTNQAGIAAGRYYKFEAEERRQWFVLRIARPQHRRDHGLWECRLRIHVAKEKAIDSMGEELQADKWHRVRTHVIQLESRKVLSPHHPKDLIEFKKKEARRKARRNEEFYLWDKETANTQENDNRNTDGELFSFEQKTGDSYVIARHATPTKVEFTRAGESVQFMRNDVDYSALNGDKIERKNLQKAENIDEDKLDNPRGIGIDENDKANGENGHYDPFASPIEHFVSLPTSDGLLWNQWLFRKQNSDRNNYNADRFQNEPRKYWWQDEWNCATCSKWPAYKIALAIIFLAYPQRIILS